MSKVDDVAAAVLDRHGRPMSAMKLQKLMYYCQAWHLTWHRTPLFPGRIEAWANGPVIVDLYRKHRGSYEISGWPLGNPVALDFVELATIVAVLGTYGPRTARSLGELTHREAPWLQARNGLEEGARR